MGFDWTAHKYEAGLVGMVHDDLVFVLVLVMVVGLIRWMCQWSCGCL